MDNKTGQFEWCYVSGRINVLECALLTSAFFDRLLFCNSFNEIPGLLNNTPLKPLFTHIKHLYEFEALLSNYYYQQISEIRAFSPTTTIYDFFLIKQDILNLKKFVKAIILGANVDENMKKAVIVDSWDDVWQGNAPSLPNVLSEAILCIKRDIVQHSPKRTPSSITMQNEELQKSPFEKRGRGGFRIPFIVDLIFDGAYLRYVESIYKKTTSEIIRKYLIRYQLIKGIEIIHRAIALKHDMNLLCEYFLAGFDDNHIFRKLILPKDGISGNTLREALGGAHYHTPLLDQNFIQILSSDLFSKISLQYEVTTDNYLMDLIRPVKYIPFGPERVFGYLCGLATEVFNVKLVLGGKVHKIENNLLKERLRKPYT